MIELPWSLISNAFVSHVSLVIRFETLWESVNQKINEAVTEYYIGLAVDNIG